MTVGPRADASRLDIGDLRDFIAVVDAGSLTRAAAVVGVSQPAVSQRMSHLESEVGARLLERGPRGVEPTSLGLELYRGAQQVVRQFDRLAESVSGGGTGAQGSVSVGLPSTVAGVLVPPLLATTTSRHPGVRLELFESMSGYVQEMLGRGRLDLAVLYRDDAAHRPGEVALYSEDLCLLTASAVDPSTAPVRLRDLAARPIVAPGARSNLRDVLERAFASHGLVPHVVADIESLPAMVRIAQSGQASAVLPRSVVAGYAGDELAVRPVVEPVLRRWVSVCVATEFYEPRTAVVAVRDAIVEVVRDLASHDAWPGITPVAPRTRRQGDAP